jgi:hypothetical protein
MPSIVHFTNRLTDFYACLYFLTNFMFQRDNSQFFFWFVGTTSNLRNTSFSHNAHQTLHVLSTLITLRTECYVKTDLCTFHTELLCYNCHGHCIRYTMHMGHFTLHCTVHVDWSDRQGTGALWGGSTAAQCPPWSQSRPEVKMASLPDLSNVVIYRRKE